MIRVWTQNAAARTHSLHRPFIHSFTHSFIHSPIHLFMPSFIYSLNRGVLGTFLLLTCSVLNEHFSREGMNVCPYLCPAFSGPGQALSLPREVPPCLLPRATLGAPWTFDVMIKQRACCRFDTCSLPLWVTTAAPNPHRPGQPGLQPASGGHMLCVGTHFPQGRCVSEHSQLPLSAQNAA